MTLRRMLAAAASLFLLAATPPLGAQEGEAPGFTAPTEPMKLTRVLERALGDGNAVVVTRSWRVRFEPRSDGYSVEGELIAAEVEAPPRLAKLAEVVRNNPQNGLFPMTLDRAGIIVTEEPEDLPPVAGLTEAAKNYVEGRDRETQERAMRYVLAAQQAGSRMMSRWPADLFYPAHGPRGGERTLAAPGGEGSLTVRFSGTLDAEGRHLATAERRIVTRVGIASALRAKPGGSSRSNSLVRIAFVLARYYFTSLENPGFA